MAIIEHTAMNLLTRAKPITSDSKIAERKPERTRITSKKII